MKVLHVISSLGPGGAQKTLLNICRTSTATTNIVFPLVFDPNEREEKRKNRIKLVTERTSLTLGSLCGVIREISKAIGREKPEVVVAWMYHSAIIVALATRGLSPKPKVIWMIRQASPLLATRSGLTRVVIVATGLISRFTPDIIVYVSRAAARFHQKYLGYPLSKQDLLPNPALPLMGPTQLVGLPRLCDPSRFPNRTLFPRDELVLGVLTRPGKKLSLRPLLTACNRIREAHRAKVTLVIRGIEKLPWSLRSNRAGNDHVFLEPWDPNTASFFSSIDVLVHTGKAEGMSNTVLDATVAGVPTIALETEINIEITHKSIALVKKYSAPHFQAAIERILMLRANYRLPGVVEEAATTCLRNFSETRFFLDYHHMLFRAVRTDSL